MSKLSKNNSLFWQTITGMDVITKNKTACPCGCGFNALSQELIDALESIKGKGNFDIVVSNACRCKNHNAAPDVLGSKKSLHLPDKDGNCNAADIFIMGRLKDLFCYATNIYRLTKGIGYYPMDGIIHFDTRLIASRWLALHQPGNGHKYLYMPMSEFWNKYAKIY